jgi:hypothetical protein
MADWGEIFAAPKMQGLPPNPEFLALLPEGTARPINADTAWKFVPQERGRPRPGGERAGDLRPRPVSAKI